MNKVGLSTGCFYPEPNENVIKQAADGGVKTIELFINTHSEMSAEYVREFRKKLDFYGVSADSVHPFTSFAESYLFFSDYRRRLDDGVEIYDRYFDICGELGAKILNFHGLKSELRIPVEKYCEVYSLLYGRAKKSGVIFSQENVRQYVCGDLDYIKSVAAALGNEVAFTFDVKQAHMMGYNPLAFSNAVADRLCLVHINDFDEKKPCLLPGAGSFDIAALIKQLHEKGYKGNYITEVYSGNYAEKSELFSAVRHTENILKECCK